jgi:molecular chaperone GrpE
MNQEENKITSDEELLQTEEQTLENNANKVQDNADTNEKTPNWEHKFNELNDRYLRLYSEFDNFRRRSAKERIDFAKTANADIFTVLLPVLDDFDRAAKASETTNDLDSLKEGMKLIHQKFKQTLILKGLEEMTSIGTDFDSDLHEAITSIPADSPENKGKVVEELERGYQLNGKVIRFAKVIVGS